MNLRSWNSNSKKLQQEAGRVNILDTDDVTKVLGLRWEPSTDEVTYVKRDIPVSTYVTKKVILKYSSQIYDPLGILCPVTVRAKLLLQDIWKRKYEWDVPLPEDIQQSWSSLAKDLNTVATFKFPRRYFSETGETGSDSRTTLQIFVDASIRSYGATAFICNGKDSTLVMAKNRVAPLKPLTLPKLELMAALIGARLAKYLQTTFPTADITLWSDSQIVLYWLSTKKTLKRFIENRVKEICDLTSQYAWKYCPTSENPADLLTRGITAEKFMKNDLWMKGPIWLCDKTKWPIWEVSNRLHVQTIIEEQATGSQQAEIDEQMISEVTHHVSSNNIQNIIDIRKFSNLSRLLRITAYIRRFIENCKVEQSRRNFDHLSTSELQQAEQRWIHYCQADVYSTEIQELVRNQVKSPLIKQLRLFLDQTGCIRCGGRLNNAAVDDVTKYPYLLPKKSRLTKLIVRNAHECLCHSGLNATVTSIRQSFLVPAIRQCVNAVIRNCVTCRKVHGLPYKSPEVPLLPKFRVEEAPPLTITGVDFTGTLYIKEPSGTEKKAYICLFTCAVTRAVHLEVVTSVSADCFLQAVRRFSSRKSQPKLIVSDNAKTFQTASTYLKAMFESQVVRESLANTGIDWKFIPERAPWYGGWWERLIGLTKQTLKKILGRAMVDLETLQTIVTEIESLLNDRPLTFV
ncbi:uncharacterized protein LOC132727351 [Ruditapes philippinarum]|uniref:uncharacterized protein LOC132727351 n=1 Tax=Ruditapes philippinarum TaxID=129788 RepID=UPI00295AED47|nr:uncharacterized protein LOC132727351 [Ruditapes philippinarum]